MHFQEACFPGLKCLFFLLLQGWCVHLQFIFSVLHCEWSTTHYMCCHSLKHTKEHIDHMVWTGEGLDPSLLLFNPSLPRLLWTTQLSLSNAVLYYKKHIISKHAPFVYRFVCAHGCLCAPLSQSRRGAEAEAGGGASSTCANWILPKRDSDEVLFIAAVIVSIFTPVHEYYSTPARSTCRNPGASQLIY